VKLIRIIFFLICIEPAVADITKTVSAEVNNIAYVTYNDPNGNKVTIYKKDMFYFWEYEGKNLRFTVEHNSDQTHFSGMLIKNRTVYRFKILSKEKKLVKVDASKEESPTYNNVNFSGECYGPHKPSLEIFDFDSIGNSLNDESVLSFSDSCTGHLKKILGPNFKKLINEEVISQSLWNEEATVNAISKEINNINILAISRRGLDEIKEGKRKISLLSCETGTACEANGSYSPTKKTITLFPECFENLKDAKCKLYYTLKEELLHEITGVGNEQTAHNDIKLIAAKTSSCMAQKGHQIDLNSSENRADFNKQKIISIKPSELPKQPTQEIAPDNLAQTFTNNPSVYRNRTVTASVANMNGFQETINWVNTVGHIITEKDSERPQASALPSQPRKPASTSIKSMDPMLIKTNGSNETTSQEDSKSTSLLQGNDQSENKQSETAAEISDSGKRSTQPKSTEPGIRRVRNDSQQSFSAPAIQSKMSGSQNLPAFRRNTASTTQTSPLDSSTLGALPDEVAQAMKDAQISDVATLKSRIQDNRLRQQLSMSLQKRKISIVGLSNQPLGVINLKNAKHIYNYSEQEGSKPQFKKVQLRNKKNNPIDL